MNKLLLALVMILPTGIAADIENSFPVFFFGNSGQFNSEIRFIVNTPQLRAAFVSDSVVFQAHGAETAMLFRGANSDVTLEGIAPRRGTVNVLAGSDPSKWRTSATYEQIAYRELYPGIDLTYAAAGTRIKSEFRVQAGADPRRIQLEYSRADRVRIASDGGLVVAGASGELRDGAPEIYQESSNGRIAVRGRYRMFDDHTVGFDLDPYDNSKPLIIDPVVSYATYLGGSGMGAVTGIAVDSSNNVYLTGWTEALDFPIHGAPQAANLGGVDVFVAKLSANGSSLLYATYIGGSSSDSAAGIAVDALGEAYVTGFTTSSNFPLVSPVQSTLRGGRDAFIFKLNSAGSQLLFSTYFGGSSWDSGTAIAVDSAGNAYVAGDTQSSDLPVANALQPTFGGQTDAFVAKFTPGGTISFSTYLGGSDSEHGGAIAVDLNGNVYVGGGTYSTNFPVDNALQTANAGGQDAFLTKINAGGSTLAYSTYFGGSGGSFFPEEINGLAVDAAGNAYVAGATNSVNLTTTSGAIRSIYNGMQDAFAAKIGTTGTLIYSGYLGGSTSNWATSVAVDAGGNAYVGGATSSVDYPVLGAIQGTFGGAYDAFISQINPTGTALVFSTLYGGGGSDVANAIVLDGAGDIYIAGETASADFPLAAALQSSYPGSATGFVVRMAAPLPAAVNPSPADGAAGVTASPNLSWVESGASSFDIYFGTSSTPPYVATNSANTYNPGTLLAGQTYHWQVVSKNGTTSVNSPVWSFTVQAAACSYIINPQNVSLTAAASTGPVSVSTTSPCGWTATSNATWLTITAGSSGTGSGNVNYSAAANIGTGARSGTLTIAGNTFTVTQAGSSGCSYGITPPSQTLPPGAGTGSVSVSASAGCSWTAASNALWLTITSKNSGTGTDNVTYSVAPNTGTSARTGSLTIAGLALNVSQASATAADFDGNGVPELIWQNDTSRQATIWYMGGSGGASLLSWNWLSSSGMAGWQIVAVADFNRDGHPDIVWQNDSTRQAIVWYMGGVGGATMLSSSTLTAGVAGWTIVGAADLNSDGYPDLIWQNDATRQVTAWFMGGAGGSTMLSWTWLNTNSNIGWHVAAVGDLDVDGHPDLLWQNDTTNQLTAWFLGGTQGVTLVASTPVVVNGMSGWKVRGAADFNRDGQPDLIWENTSTRQVQVSYMGGGQGMVTLSWAWLCNSGEPGWTVQ